MTDAPLTQPVSRRTFISKSLAIVGLSAVMPAAFVRAVFAEEPIGSPAPLASTAGQAGRTFVIVQLAGGNDGLNTLVPYADGAYYDARPGLAVNPEAALHLDDRVALHPNLGGLKRLFDSGRLAIVQGAGYPEPNRSHFRSMEIWHTASTASDVHDGWLGRLLDVTKQESSALWRAANVGAAAPLSLASQRSFVPSLDSVPAYVLQTDPRLPLQSDRRLTPTGAASTRYRPPSAARSPSFPTPGSRPIAPPSTCRPRPATMSRPSSTPRARSRRGCRRARS